MLNTIRDILFSWVAIFDWPLLSGGPLFFGGGEGVNGKIKN